MKNTDISRVSPDRSADVIYRPQLPLVERRGGWFVSAISELYKIFFFLRNHNGSQIYCLIFSSLCDFLKQLGPLAFSKHYSLILPGENTVLAEDYSIWKLIGVLCSEVSVNCFIVLLWMLW